MSQLAIADIVRPKKGYKSLVKPNKANENTVKPLLEFKTRRRAHSRQQVLAQIKSSRIPLSEIVTPWDAKTLKPSRVRVRGAGVQPQGYVTHLTFKRTIIQNPLRIVISGVSAADYGTVVKLYLNGTFVRTITLVDTASAPEVVLNMQPGNNSLGFSPTLIPCGCSIAYARIDYGNNVLPGEITTSTVFLQSGLDTPYGPLGFPQIVIPENSFPESAAHIRNAWAGTQATPIGNNPPDRLGVPPQSPRLVTLDRPNATKRRSKSTRGITCVEATNGKIDEKDEYPPAVSLESYNPLATGSINRANIRCIPYSDNKASGPFAQGQFNFYATTIDAPTVKIPDNSVVEYVVGQ